MSSPSSSKVSEIDVANFNRTGAVTSRPQNEAITPAVALVVKPINNLSLYGNYIEGLTSGVIAPIGTVNVGQVFPAIVAKQIEVGAKYDFGAVGVSLAAFEITQPNGFTNPATNIFSVDGEKSTRVYAAGVLLYGQRPGLMAVVRAVRHPV